MPNRAGMVVSGARVEHELDHGSIDLHVDVHDAAARVVIELDP